MTILNNKRHAIFPILSVMFFDQTCLSIIFPVVTFVFFDSHSRLFPESTSHAVRSLWYGICIALPQFVNIFMVPFLSALSDGVGRKKIILLATIGTVLVAMLGALSVELGVLSLLVVTFFIQGLFSRTDPVAIAAMGDIAPKENKVIFMGYLQTAISLGALLGPVIGGFFAMRYFFSTLNFALPFLMAGCFALMATFIAHFFLKETLSTPLQKPKVGWKEVKKVFANPIVLRLTLILLLSQFSWRIYYQYIPPILKTEFNVSPHELGLFVGMIAFWLSVATAFGIRLLEPYFSLEKMLRNALQAVLFGILITILFCLLHLPVMLVWLAVIPIAMGDVIAFSCITTLYSNAVLKEEQGKVMGVCFIVVSLIWALTGLLGGLLMSLHPLLPLLIAPLGVAFAILFLTRESTRQIHLSQNI